MASRTYTIKAATEWGAGKGPNGTGKRAKVTGWYVVRDGRNIRAFTGPNAEKQATKWAAFCNENFLRSAA